MKLADGQELVPSRNHREEGGKVRRSIGGIVLLVNVAGADLVLGGNVEVYAVCRGVGIVEGSGTEVELTRWYSARTDCDRGTAKTVGADRRRCCGA